MTAPRSRGVSSCSTSAPWGSSATGINTPGSVTIANDMVSSFGHLKISNICVVLAFISGQDDPPALLWRLHRTTVGFRSPPAETARLALSTALPAISVLPGPSSPAPPTPKDLLDPSLPALQYLLVSLLRWTSWLRSGVPGPPLCCSAACHGGWLSTLTALSGCSLVAFATTLDAPADVVFGFLSVVLASSAGSLAATDVICYGIRATLQHRQPYVGRLFCDK